MSLPDALFPNKKPAEFYKARIEIENTFTPREFLNIARRRDELSPAAQEWLDFLTPWMLAEVPCIQEFQRQECAPKPYPFYRCTAPEGAVRHLLIALCGRAHRLLTPIPLFLQHLPSRCFDVLLLKDPTGRKYMHGLSDYADGLTAWLNRLKEEVGAMNYDSVRVVGTSAGGAAALLVGAHLGAERAVCIAGVNPDKENPEQRFLERVKQTAATATTRLLCVTGSENQSDRSNARELATPLGAAILHTPGGTPHGATLADLSRQYVFADFLRTTLLDEDAPFFLHHAAPQEYWRYEIRSDAPTPSQAMARTGRWVLERDPDAPSPHPGL